MRTARRFPVRLFAALLVTGLLPLTGCEAIFTSSPFTALQRKPSDLSPEQRITYAQDALASGDPAAMQTALDAIKNDTSSTAVYTAAELEIELSGLPALVASVVGNLSDPSAVAGGATSVDAFLAAHPEVQPAMLIDAGARLQGLDTAGAVLTDSDRILGAIGLALGGATPSYTSVSPASLTAAINLVTPAAAGDPVAQQILAQLNAL